LDENLSLMGVDAGLWVCEFQFGNFQAYGIIVYGSKTISWLIRRVVSFFVGWLAGW
jgi:hypothetical protein